MEQSEFIKKSRRNVMMRISVFLLYYILLLVFTFVLVLLLLGASAFFLFNILSFLNRLGIVVAIFLGSSWIFVIKNGFRLLRSPFIVTKYDREDHIEVTESECPELFKNIREVAAFTGCEMPKHVYLSPDVNACLFYNTSFWNIFFPVKKELEIGVGLMYCMSSEELKSVIAHEFGHYTQKTGKIDGIINRTITVLDNMMQNIELPGFLHKLTFKVYSFVQRGNLRFSRQLEYNADSVSCACVGKDVFVSGMCKIEILASRQQNYDLFVTHLLQEKKQCEDYWEGYARIIPYLEKNDAAKIEFSTPLVEPFATASKLPSRLKVNNIWASHPSLEDRIREANKTEKVSSKDENAVIDATTLVSGNVLKKLGLIKLNTIKKEFTDLNGIESITPEQFEEWAKNNQDKYLIPAPLIPFLQRDFCSLVDQEILNNPETLCDDSVLENPFTIENMEIVKRYHGAVNDLSLMQSIENGSYEVTEFLYNGVLYTKKTNPVNEQIKVVEALRPKAVKIDNAIFSYLLSKTDNKSLVIRQYEVVRYAQQILPKISKLIETRNQTIALINAATKSGNSIEKDLYDHLISQLVYLSTAIGSVTKVLNYDLLSDVLNSASITYLSEYHKITHCSSVKIKPNQVNAMSYLVDLLYNMHVNLHNDYSTKLIDEIQKYVTDEDQNVLFEHIKSQSDLDYGYEQSALDAEFMERVEKSEALTIILCLLGEFVVLVALFFVIHISSGLISTYFFGPSYTVVTAYEGEQSDGIISFTVPEGYECEYIPPTEESNGCFILNSGDCEIQIFSGISENTLSKDDCVAIWNNFADGYGFPKDANLEKNQYTSDGKIHMSFWRKINLEDTDGNPYEWDFKIVYVNKLRKIAIISSVKPSDFQNYVNMANKIRFE